MTASSANSRSEQPHPRPRRRSRFARAIVYGLLLGVAVAFLLPLVWMGATSLKPTDQSLSSTTQLLPTVTEIDRMRAALETLNSDASGGAAEEAADLRLRLAAAEQPLEESRIRRGELRDQLSRLQGLAGAEMRDQVDSIEAEIRAIDEQLAQGLGTFDPEYWRGVAGFTRRNYRDVWNSPAADFPLYLRNTLIISLLSVLGMVLSSAIVAYGFSRLRWRGRGVVFAFVLSTMMIPFAVLMAPLYVFFKQLGWIGTFKPLWVPAWFGGAFSIFLLRQFFLTIPRELDEAAMIDGCSHVGVFWRIILPLSKPALLVVALFQFIASWNDFVGPLIFLNHEEKFTLALGLYMYQSQHGGTPWNLVMTASVLVILPVLVVFMLAQRYFVEGIATLGIKE